MKFIVIGSVDIHMSLKNLDMSQVVKNFTSKWT